MRASEPTARQLSFHIIQFIRLLARLVERVQSKEAATLTEEFTEEPGSSTDPTEKNTRKKELKKPPDLASDLLLCDLPPGRRLSFSHLELALRELLEALEALVGARSRVRRAS